MKVPLIDFPQSILGWALWKLSDLAELKWKCLRNFPKPLFYLLCLTGVIKKAPLPPCWNGLRCFPCFNPHVTWNLHSGAQLTLDDYTPLFIHSFLFNVIPGWIPSHKIFQTTTRVGSLRGTGRKKEGGGKEHAYLYIGHGCPNLSEEKLSWTTYKMHNTVNIHKELHFFYHLVGLYK